MTANDRTYNENGTKGDTKKKICGMGVIVFLIILIGQYILFTKGILNPIKSDYSLDFTHRILYVDESIEYNVENYVKPSYAKKQENGRIHIVDEDVAIVEENCIKGVSDGKTEIVLYDGNKEIDRKKIEVISKKAEENKKNEDNKNNDGFTQNIIIDRGNSEYIRSGRVNLPSYNDSSYMFYNIDREYLQESDINYLDKNQLSILRNEIFARHGHKFWTEPYKSYFNSKGWYYSLNREVSVSELNKYEKANLSLIQRYE